MPKIRKLVIGIRPAKRLFRLSSQAGIIVDTIVDAVGNSLPDGYVTQVKRTGDDQLTSLTSEDGLTTLTLNVENILLTKDYYDNHKHCDQNEVLKEFRTVWEMINKILQVREIRRIGIFAEYRFKPAKDNPSADLLALLSSVQREGYPAKFVMSFETRLNAKTKGAIDPETSDFLNIGENYYDSEVDSEHSAKGFINANLDVQRYFAPVIGDIKDHLVEVNTQFEKSSKAFLDRVKKLGLTDAQW